MKLSFINTEGTDPHRNLALEEYLLERVGEDEMILYLWQNRHTVVIGKNQNAYKECKVDALEQSGGFLARRPSGGGAVYHDMGNLNFTFLTRSKHYDVGRQLEVIAGAVRAFGLDAQRTGRNDVCVDERKFSGNAFLKRGDRQYHHGTVLVAVDMGRLSEFLNVSQKKLEAKGVESVRSRVVNLSALNPKITVEGMRHALRAAFEQVYGGASEEIFEREFDSEQIAALTEKYRSREWRFPEKAAAALQLNEHFSWGEITIGLDIAGDQVRAASVYSDAMDVDFAPLLESALAGCRFSKTELAQRAEVLERDYAGMAADIKRLLLSQDS